MMDAEEVARRTGYLDAIDAFFKAHPMRWHEAKILRQIGGQDAWRTRVSECRTQRHMRIENRQSRVTGVVISEYRYVPYEPLGRDSGTRVPQKGLF